MPDLPRPAQEHDIPVRARDVPDVRRPHHRVSHLSQAGREADPTLLNNALCWTADYICHSDYGYPIKDFTFSLPMLGRFDRPHC